MASEQKISGAQRGLEPSRPRGVW